MSYTPIGWKDVSDPLNPGDAPPICSQNLKKMEDGIIGAEQKAVDIGREIIDKINRSRIMVVRDEGGVIQYDVSQEMLSSRNEGKKEIKYLKDDREEIIRDDRIILSDSFKCDVRNLQHTRKFGMTISSTITGSTKGEFIFVLKYKNNNDEEIMITDRFPNDNGLSSYTGSTSVIISELQEEYFLEKSLSNSPVEIAVELYYRITAWGASDISSHTLSFSNTSLTISMPIEKREIIK